jgi:hypothetical protein
MVKLNNKKYNYIIESFKNDINKTTIKNNQDSTKKETILDIGKKIIDDIPKQIENFTDIKTKIQNLQSLQNKINEKTEHFANTNKQKERFISIPGVGGGGGIPDIENTIKNALKGPFEEVKNALVKPFEEIIKFFEKVKVFFEKLAEAFTFTFEKLSYVLLTIFLPYVGQLYTRIMYLDGSLDKPWLFFFSVAPFSIVPALMIMFGLIEKGKGGKPWDFYILIPIVVNIFAGFIANKYYTGIKATIVKYLLVLVSFIISYYLRSRKICDSKSALITKISSDALLTHILIGVIAIVLQYIPFIGIAVRIITKLIPYGYLVIDAIAILLVYVATNMINGSSKNYCTDSSSINYIIQLLIGSIVVTYAKKING